VNGFSWKPFMSSHCVWVNRGGLCRFYLISKGIKWRVGRKELEDEENFFSSSFSFKRFVFKRWKALIQAWFEFYLVKWIHFRWYMHDGSLKFVEWMFKLMVLCLNDIHKHEIWSWDNDSIGRIEETIYPPSTIDGFRPRQKEKKRKGWE